MISLLDMRSIQKANVHGHGKKTFWWMTTMHSIVVQIDKFGIHTNKNETFIYEVELAAAYLVIKSPFQIVPYRPTIY